MKDIDEIYAMLDWNQPNEIQKQGIDYAKNLDLLHLFIQPMDYKYPKNIWENCSIVVCSKSDAELQEVLVLLMEWIQDLNWPGAFNVFDRLRDYNKNTAFYTAYNECINKAEYDNDEIWKEILQSIIK